MYIATKSTHVNKYLLATYALKEQLDLVICCYATDFNGLQYIQCHTQFFTIHNKHN